MCFLYPSFSFHLAVDGPGTFFPLLCVYELRYPFLEHYFFISLLTIVVPVDDERISKITVQENESKNQ